MVDTLSRLLGDGIHAWAIATAAMVAAGCALVGTLLVVRRMSLMGDAISHAVLPGIVLAVMAGGRPGGPLVIAGAVAAALITVWLTQVFRSQGGLAEDAGAGVAFTTLFALGVVLVTAAASRIDLDPACVLYGVLELVPFDTVSLAGFEVPRAFVSASLVFTMLLLAAFLCWPRLVFASFDASAARAAGLPVSTVTTGLLAATALVTVAGFEAVGAILVVALLVVPAATAELLTRRLHRVAALAIVLAVVAAVVGYLLAWRWNTSAAGMIAVVLGLQYAVGVLVAPEDGVVSRLWSRCWLHWRVACEDQLAACWRFEEGSTPRPAAALSVVDRLALWWLAVTGHVVVTSRGWMLSARGRIRANTVVRSHRLWEAWLGRHAHLPLDHLHPPAEWIEHHLGADVRRRIEADVGPDASDPHGRSIPPEA